MSGLRVVGGLLALAAGVLSLLVPLDLLVGIGIFDPTKLGFTYGLLALVNGDIYVYLGLIFAILAIIGGLVGMAKKAGGGIALIIGIIWIIGGFIMVSVPILFPMSAMLLWTDQIVIGTTGVLTIEAILCLVGGILILASSSD
ncbi:MAG: hypothetical protein ACTSQ8_22135 [Candidatus Helarchaeota archaeon]